MEMTTLVAAMLIGYFSIILCPKTEPPHNKPSYEERLNEIEADHKRAIASFKASEERIVRECNRKRFFYGSLGDMHRYPVFGSP